MVEGWNSHQGLYSLGMRCSAPTTVITTTTRTLGDQGNPAVGALACGAERTGDTAVGAHTLGTESREQHYTVTLAAPQTAITVRRFWVRFLPFV